MTGRRVLAKLLTELAAEGAAAFADVAAKTPVRARSLSLSLPIDLRVVASADGPQIVCDVPLFVTRPDFDPDHARSTRVRWHRLRTIAAREVRFRVRSEVTRNVESTAWSGVPSVGRRPMPGWIPVSGDRGASACPGSCRNGVARMR